ALGHLAGMRPRAEGARRQGRVGGDRLLARREGQRREAVPQRLDEDDRPPEERPAEEAEAAPHPLPRPPAHHHPARGPAGPHRREGSRRAHHHALDDRLAADLDPLHRSPGLKDYAPFSVVAFSAFSFLPPRPYFLLKRSMRPWVSMSFCFPVKNGWQFAQISTMNGPRVENVSYTAPQAQVLVDGL